jgi:hypothetical protein
MNLPENEAGASAIEASSDEALRVPCYCEENVWRLAYRKLKQQRGETRYYVVFVSSEEKVVPMLYQKASEAVNGDSNEPVFWDYHVILLEMRERECNIIDIDTCLSPFPAPLNFYLDNSFSPDEFTEAVDPRFRVIDATVFLNNFCSDREHMRKDGKWTAAPPTYKCIQVDASKPTSNLDSYRVMTKADLKSGQRVDHKFGKVMTMDQLRDFAVNGSVALSTDCSMTLCFG